MQGPLFKNGEFQDGFSRTLNGAWGSSQPGTPCDCTACMRMKGPASASRGLERPWAWKQTPACLPCIDLYASDLGRLPFFMSPQLSNKDLSLGRNHALKILEKQEH